jgi:hypothetical protein
MLFSAHEVEMIYILRSDSTGTNMFSNTASTSSKRQNYRELKLSIKWEGVLALCKIALSQNSDEASPAGTSGRSDQLDCVFDQ